MLDLGAAINLSSEELLNVQATCCSSIKIKATAFCHITKSSSADGVCPVATEVQMFKFQRFCAFN